MAALTFQLCRSRQKKSKKRRKENEFGEVFNVITSFSVEDRCFANGWIFCMLHSIFFPFFISKLSLPLCLYSHHPPTHTNTHTHPDNIDSVKYLFSLIRHFCSICVYPYVFFLFISLSVFCPGANPIKQFKPLAGVK